MAQTVLVTGVAGFIGPHVARRLMRDGYNVVGVDDLSSGSIGNVPEGVEFINANLADSAIAERLPQTCACILHLAGQSSGEISFDDPIADLQKNTVTTLNLIRYGIKRQVERIVYASSMSVYGDVEDAPIAETHFCEPLSCYGVGKLAAERYLRIYHRQVPFVALRMFNVYGPGQDMTNLRQGMVSIYLAQALNGGRIHVKGSVERFRDFVYIDDVVEAWTRAATNEAALGRCLNVATGVRVSVRQLLDQIERLVPGCESFSEGATPGDQRGIYGDNGELSRCLGIARFTSLDVGLRQFVNWARTRGVQ